MKRIGVGHVDVNDPAGSARVARVRTDNLQLHGPILDEAVLRKLVYFSFKPQPSSKGDDDGGEFEGDP